MGAFEFDRWDVRGVVFDPAAFRLAWSTVADASGYLVQRGEVQNLATGDQGTCLTDTGDLPINQFDDATLPAIGEVLFYIVAARVDGAVATLGFDSRGLERIPAPGSGCL